MYLVFISFVTLLTLLLPVMVPRIASHYNLSFHDAPVWLPFLAAALYFSAGFLPDVHVTSDTNTFQEHFVGGGLYTTVLFIYFTRLFDWRFNRLLTFAALFAWTSALGVLNELVEFVVVKLNVTHINISDTSWDLVANTCGMLCGFIFWQGLRILHRNNKGKL